MNANIRRDPRRDAPRRLRLRRASSSTAASARSADRSSTSTSSAFAFACALAFGNYVLRFLKWEFYLARLDIRGVKKIDSFLTFLSGFVLTVTPGKVGEVFKSLILFETHGVPMTKTAPIVVAERATDVIGIVAAHRLRRLARLLRAVSSGPASARRSSSRCSSWSRNRKLSLWLIGIVGAPARPLRQDRAEARGRVREPRDDARAAEPLRAEPPQRGAWMLECLALWVILGGFGETTSIPLSTFFYATSTLVGAIVPVPGGLGVTESALMGQMTELGHVERSIATAAMILVRFATLWFAVIVGFVALSLHEAALPDVAGEGRGAQGRDRRRREEGHRADDRRSRVRRAQGGALKGRPRRIQTAKSGPPAR